jgi:16S rRNA (cytosine1402-N4)-methyltransferase
MKLCTTSSDPAADRHVARASWPLSEPALAYFPDARFALSDRDLGAGTFTRGLDGFTAMPDHVPVLLDRCVELLAPALTRNDADGSGAVLIDATLGAGGSDSSPSFPLYA